MGLAKVEATKGVGVGVCVGVSACTCAEVGGGYFSVLYGFNPAEICIVFFLPHQNFKRKGTAHLRMFHLQRLTWRMKTPRGCHSWICQELG